MPTLVLPDVPEEVMEQIERSAALHNRTPAEEAIAWLRQPESANLGVPIRESKSYLPSPIPDPIPDCMLVPDSWVDVWPELPPGISLVPKDGGPVTYQPCCEFEEERPE